MKANISALEDQKEKEVEDEENLNQVTAFDNNNKTNLVRRNNNDSIVKNRKQYHSPIRFSYCETKMKTKLLSSDKQQNSCLKLIKKNSNKASKTITILLILFTSIHFISILVNGKGLVGKLPGNPASCPEEPCNSDPQHVIHALKITLVIFVVVLLVPLILYYLSRFYTYCKNGCVSLDAADTSSSTKGDSFYENGKKASSNGSYNSGASDNNNNYNNNLNHCHQNNNNNHHQAIKTSSTVEFNNSDNNNNNIQYKKKLSNVDCSNKRGSRQYLKTDQNNNPSENGSNFDNVAQQQQQNLQLVQMISNSSNSPNLIRQQQQQQQDHDSFNRKLSNNYEQINNRRMSSKSKVYPKQDDLNLEQLASIEDSNSNKILNHEQQYYHHHQTIFNNNNNNNNIDTYSNSPTLINDSQSEQLFYTNNQNMSPELVQVSLVNQLYEQQLLQQQQQQQQQQQSNNDNNSSNQLVSKGSNSLAVPVNNQQLHRHSIDGSILNKMAHGMQRGREQVNSINYSNSIKKDFLRKQSKAYQQQQEQMMINQNNMDNNNLDFIPTISQNIHNERGQKSASAAANRRNSRQQSANKKRFHNNNNNNNNYYQIQNKPTITTNDGGDIITNQSLLPMTTNFDVDNNINNLSPTTLSMLKNQINLNQNNYRQLLMAYEPQKLAIQQADRRPSLNPALMRQQRHHL